MYSGALLSPCNSYRYKLWRVWDDSKPLILWLMHNPSTADGNKDDPTIRRIIKYSMNWGYDGLYVGNLFPYRSTDPKNLLNKSLEEICPSENKVHIEQMVENCSEWVLAHGNPSVYFKMENLPSMNWKALKLTKKGYACHPLYLKADLKLFSLNDNV